MNSAQTLRVGGVPEHFNLPWHLAIESGDARDSGVCVEWSEYTTGTGAMLADLADRRLDIAVLLTEGAALGLARRLPIEAVSLYTTSPLIWGVHVPATSGIRSVSDLAGLRFGISRHGSGSHLMALALAMERGWALSGLEFVIVDNLPGAIEAFSSGLADVFLWEHFTTQPAVDAGHFRRIDDFAAPWPAWVVCANRHALECHAASVDSLIGIVARHAVRLAAAGDAATVIAKRYGLEPAAVGEWLAGTQWVDGKSSPVAALELAESMLRRAGAI
jgi:sulfonate transport system substrate-binding protein